MLTAAHRGYSTKYPENTLLAFRKALEVNTDAIECDVHLSKDGHLIVMHDFDLDRTSNGTGRISDWTLEELKKLDAGSWFSEEFKNERIPTFEEVLNLLDDNVYFVIEVKIDDLVTRTMKKTITEKLTTALAKRSRLEKTIIISFDYEMLRIVREISPEMNTGFIFESINEYEYVASHNFEDLTAICPRYDLATEEVITTCKKRNLVCFVWVIDDEPTMRAFLDKDLWGIGTNDPELLLRIQK